MILLFGTMGDIGPAVRDSLERRGEDIALVDFPQNVFRDEWGYRRNLTKAIATFRPQMILPIGHPLALARYIENPPEGSVFAPISSAETIALLDSKVRSSALATRLGIPQPQLFERPEDAPVAATIFKRDRSFGGSGVYRPKTLESLLHLMHHEEGAPYLIEAFVEGEDISVDCVRMGGRGGDTPQGKSDGVFFQAQCYRSLGRRQGQGPSAQREIVDCPEAVGYARTILESVGFQGVCGMDFRRSADGKLYFLECNPRFTGGIRTQIDSGFDIPWLWVSHCR